jgi:hypothetical protein
MATHPPTQPCGELLLSLHRQVKEANQKLDHIILCLGDDYYRHFYELYRPDLEETTDRFNKDENQ